MVRASRCQDLALGSPTSSARLSPGTRQPLPAVADSQPVVASRVSECFLVVVPLALGLSIAGTPSEGSSGIDFPLIRAPAAIRMAAAHRSVIRLVLPIAAPLLRGRERKVTSPGHRRLTIVAVDQEYVVTDPSVNPQPAASEPSASRAPACSSGFAVSGRRGSSALARRESSPTGLPHCYRFIIRGPFLFARYLGSCVAAIFHCKLADAPSLQPRLSTSPSPFAVPIDQVRQACGCAGCYFSASAFLPSPRLLRRDGSCSSTVPQPRRASMAPSAFIAAWFRQFLGRRLR
jgi:hypothetical protein